MLLRVDTADLATAIVPLVDGTDIHKAYIIIPGSVQKSTTTGYKPIREQYEKAAGFQLRDKCAGRGICAWTRWWEVVYLVLPAASKGLESIQNVGPRMAQVVEGLIPSRTATGQRQG